MNIETIQMDPRIARVHYRDYMARCRLHRLAREETRRLRAAELGKEMRKVQVEKSRAEKEDQELLRAYRALMKAGTRLINLPTVITKAGLTDKEKLPRLACVPADSTNCTFNCGSPKFLSRGSRRLWNDQDVSLPRWPAEITDVAWRRNNSYPISASALVPTIPPHLRPDDASLKDYWILWEAEWQSQAPGDPILLSRVNTHTYAIVAQWDLTPLEQRVLENRL